jgi:hypothetical protein
VKADGQIQLNREGRVESTTADIDSGRITAGSSTKYARSIFESSLTPTSAGEPGPEPQGHCRRPPWIELHGINPFWATETSFLGPGAHIHRVSCSCPHGNPCVWSCLCWSPDPHVNDLDLPLGAVAPDLWERAVNLKSVLSSLRSRNHQYHLSLRQPLCPSKILPLRIPQILWGDLR